MQKANKDILGILGRGAVLVVLALCISLNAVAQHPFLSKLTTLSTAQGVHILWTMESGRTCDGIEILRKTSAGDFISLGEIEGICGDISSPVDYLFVDEAPVSGVVNDYRLRIGFNGLTDIVSQYHLDFDGQQFRVLHDIDGSRLTIVPNGPLIQTSIVDLLSSDGRVVDSFVLDSDGRSEYPLDALGHGVYFLRIQDQGRLLFSYRFVHFL